MSWNLHLAPLLPWPLVAVLLALGLIAIGVTIFDMRRGWPLRVLSLLVLGAALLGPTLRNEERDKLRDIAVAVIDHSQSQDLANRPAQTDAAEAAVKSALGRLDNTDLRIVTARSGISADRDGTRLFAALGQALADIPPERFAGAVLVTDGQVHDVPEKPDTAGPVHVLLTGSPDERDRRVVIEKAPRFGMVGKEQTIAFRIDEKGGPGTPVRVTLKSGEGASQSIEAVPGRGIEIPILVNHGGQNIVEIEAEAMPGEVSEQNNRAIAIVEGIRDRLRVLLVSGEPHPGERTWRNLLKSDPSVDLVHFTILRPPEKQDGTPIKELSLIAFPTRELFVDKLSEFDLVVFDRYQRQGVLPLIYLANVADYVEKGGAVLLAAGADFASETGLYNTPLSAVLTAAPTGQVLEGGYRPAITERGQRHPVTRNLPGSARTPPDWGRWFRLIDAQPGDGETVMSGLNDKPLLVLARRGEGRVAQLLSDHGWLWTRGFEGGGPQTELLRRMAHWLMKEPDLEEEALIGKQSQGNILIERRTMNDKAQPVEVTAPSGKTERVDLAQTAPGVWQTRIAVTEAGLYRLSDGTLTSIAAVGSADPKEAADIVATPKVLEPIARATGGGIFWLGDPARLPSFVKTAAGRQMSGSGWAGLRDNDAYRVTALREFPLYSSLLALGLLLLLFGATWWRESR
jgi:hypothetical protein